MNINSRNLKLTIGAIYLIVLTTGLFFLFSIIDLKDLTSYEFIRSNKDQILEYKNNNFFFSKCYLFYFLDNLGPSFRIWFTIVIICWFCFW